MQIFFLFIRIDCSHYTLLECITLGSSYLPIMRIKDFFPGVEFQTVTYFHNAAKVTLFHDITNAARHKKPEIKREIVLSQQFTPNFRQLVSINSKRYFAGV